MNDCDPKFIPFGLISRGRLGMQCQYGCRYLEDPEIAKGIRWTGNTDDWHGIKIHADDVEIFVQRVKSKD